MTYFKVFVPLEMCSIQIKYIIFIHLLIKAPSVIILVIFPFFYLFIFMWVVCIFICKAMVKTHCMLPWYFNLTKQMWVWWRMQLSLSAVILLLLLMAHDFLCVCLFSLCVSFTQNCPHRVAREPSMIIPSGGTCQPTEVLRVLHLPPISVAGIN